MKFHILSVLLGSTLCLSFGCTAGPRDTVGLRVFNDSPRFYDDELWVVLIDTETDEQVLRAPLASGSWSPTETHTLTRGRALRFELHFSALASGALHRSDMSVKAPLSMQQDLDIRIYWEPHIWPPGGDDEEDLTPHWQRQPRLEITEGHPAIF